MSHYEFHKEEGTWTKHVDLLSTYPDLATDPMEDFEHEDAIFTEILQKLLANVISQTINQVTYNNSPTTIHLNSQILII